MNWDKFEEVVKSIYEALGKKNDIKIECYGNACKVQGKSGVPHQVDVLTSHSDGLHNYKTAIECKYWNQNINKDIVMKVKEIINDANIDKGIIVSKNGFTPDAISFAKYSNVGLVELREPTEEDWENRIKTINITLHVQTLRIIDFQVFLKKDSNPNVTTNQSTSCPSNAYILYPDSKKLTLLEIVNQVQERNIRKKSGEQFTEKFPFPPGAKLISDEEKISLEIEGIICKATFDEAIVESQIKGEEYVWLIMKAIFEKKQFIISQNGQINEVEFGI